MTPTTLNTALPAAPAILGIAASYATELVTKSSAPDSVKRAVCLMFSTLAGVVPTVTMDPHADWQHYAAGVFAAWVGAMVTHHSGVTGPLENATSGFGLGPKSPETTPGNSGMLAGLTFSSAHTLSADQAPPLEADDDATVPAPVAGPVAQE